MSCDSAALIHTLLHLLMLNGTSCFVTLTASPMPEFLLSAIMFCNSLFHGRQIEKESAHSSDFKATTFMQTKVEISLSLFNMIMYQCRNARCCIHICFYDHFGAAEIFYIELTLTICEQTIIYTLGWHENIGDWFSIYLVNLNKILTKHHFQSDF